MACSSVNLSVPRLQMMVYFLPILFADKLYNSAYLLYFVLFDFFSLWVFIPERHFIFFYWVLLCFSLNSEWLASSHYEGCAETEYPKVLQSTQSSKLATKIHCWCFNRHITTIPYIVLLARLLVSHKMVGSWWLNSTLLRDHFRHF